MVKKIVALSLGVVLVVLAVAFAFAGKSDSVKVSNERGTPITSLEELNAAVGVLRPRMDDGEQTAQSSVTIRYNTQTTRKYQYDGDNAQSGDIFWGYNALICASDKTRYVRAECKSVNKHEQGLTSSSGMTQYEYEFLYQDGNAYARFLSFLYTSDVTDPELEEGETTPEIELTRSYADAINKSLGKWFVVNFAEEGLNEEQRNATEYCDYLIESGLSTESIVRYSDAMANGTIALTPIEGDMIAGNAYSYEGDNTSMLVVLNEGTNAYFRRTQQEHDDRGSLTTDFSVTVSGWETTTISYQVKNAIAMSEIFADLWQEEGGNV